MPLFINLKDSQVGIIERSGQYRMTVFAHEKKFLIPFVDELFIYDRLPKEFKFSNVVLEINEDNKVIFESTIKYKILEPYKARYAVEDKNLEKTIENYIPKCLKEIIETEQNVSENDFQKHFYNKLEIASKKWGFKLINANITRISGDLNQNSSISPST